MQDLYGQFQGHWQAFMALLAGKIARRTQGALPSFSHMQLILKDTASDWGSGETGPGRWLMALEKQDARKAGLIRNILLSDMHFVPLSAAAVRPPYLPAAIPAAGALAGFGIAFGLHAPVWGMALSALGAGALLVPAGKMAGQHAGENAARREREAYLSQLEKYRLSIAGILES